MMSAHLAVSGMWLQGADYASSDTMKVLMWAVIVIAFCSFVQFCVVVGIALAGLRIYKNAEKALTEAKGKAYPLIGTVQGVVQDVRPKIVSITESVKNIIEDARPKIASVTASVQSIVEDATPKVKAVTENVKTISTNVAETSTTWKDKAKVIADDVTETVGDANKKTRAQVDRVDSMVNSAFTATSEVAAKINHGIRVPVNEVVGWVNGLKAGIDKLFSHKKQASTPGPSVTGKPNSGSPISDVASSRQTAEPDYPPTATRESAPPVISGSTYGADHTQAVATLAAEQDVLSDPSSAVAPSPGAQEVVDRFLSSQGEDDLPKPVY